MIKKSSLPRTQTELTNQKAARAVVTLQGTRKVRIGYWLIMSDSKWSWKRGGTSGGKQPWCWTISVFGCFSLLLSYRSWPYFFRPRCRKKSNAFTNKLWPNFLNSNWLNWTLYRWTGLGNLKNLLSNKGKNLLRRANLGLFRKEARSSCVQTN